jgi:glycosyltransferase involved in cell wall biosynthesis
MRLAIITTHPIQYYAPVFRLLQQREKIEIKVFYTWGKNVLTDKYDPGFDKKIAWDIPLLDEYSYEWAENMAKDPGTHHFMGIVNPGLISQVGSWQPDAILVFGWGFHSHLKIIRHFKNKIPVFFRGDSTLLDEKKGLRSLFKFVFLKWVYSNIDHAFYTGTNNKAYFKKYGLKDSQLSFAPHAVDNARFALERSDEANALKQELGIKDGELVVMFAGKLEEKKEPMQLLSAFMSAEQSGTHLLFVGNGPLEGQLKTQAKNKPNVHFVDFQNQSQMPIFYQACDLFCLPSRGPRESWGLSINEAMACGKAILVSDKVGAAADLVKPNDNGLIFKADNLDDLTFKLHTLIASGKNSLFRMGEHSKMIIKNWTFENQVTAIEGIKNG